ncbi:MAG: hypothetical protein GXC73_03350, partial [Chitinophagaceae bacterium]|nr:hypothetical protein [Chitinophagaceae bacterium]
MRRYFSLLFFLMMCTGITVHAQSKHQAGVRLGSYDQVVSTGFTYRYHFNNGKAVE